MKFTLANETTVTEFGFFPYGDVKHDPLEYDVFRCDEQEICDSINPPPPSPPSAPHPHLLRLTPTSPYHPPPPSPPPPGSSPPPGRHNGIRHNPQSCTEMLASCNATVGHTTEQTCGGWGGTTVGTYWGMRIRSTGGMLDEFIGNKAPWDGCAASLASYWVRITVAAEQVVATTGVVNYGDTTHDVLEYELHVCAGASTLVTSAEFESDCSWVHTCSATVGQSNEQLCDGWVASNAGAFWALKITATGGGTPWIREINLYGDVSATFQSDVSTAATVPTDQVTVSTASMTTRRRLLLEAPMSAEARHLLATCSGTCLSTTISIIWFASGSPHATTRPAAWAQRARGRMPPALVAQFHVLSAASLDGSRNETVQPSVGSRHCGMRLSNPQPVSCSLAAERGRPAESLGGRGADPNTAALLLMNSPSDIFKQSASFVLRTATVVTGNVMSWGAISVSTPSFPSPPPNPPPAPPACTVDPCYPGVACQSTNDFELAPEGWICGECPSGLDGNGIGELGCDDVDECNVTPNGGCDNVTACVNDFGGFHCTECPTGTSGTGLLGCVDDNECLQSNGGCAPGMPTSPRRNGERTWANPSLACMTGFQNHSRVHVVWRE
ncbi:hypothetical protein CYMTET_48552 [Cymbomonas tetramitiformis]|uniref:EGF-like calcium-binding domain-containing protein n=1 Tax=Cymbomonas tetramitiformis TaxID=36881 RepID=A0AAE0EWN8_9CHLO|nr:hypothetical protein CYMTET_48552 [Cymbomonas tetramitiformis]